MEVLVHQGTYIYIYIYIRMYASAYLLNIMKGMLALGGGGLNLKKISNVSRIFSYLSFSKNEKKMKMKEKGKEKKEKRKKKKGFLLSTNYAASSRLILSLPDQSTRSNGVLSIFICRLCCCWLPFSMCLCSIACCCSFFSCRNPKSLHFLLCWDPLFSFYIS